MLRILTLISVIAYAQVGGANDAGTPHENGPKASRDATSQLLDRITAAAAATLHPIASAVAGEVFRSVPQRISGRELVAPVGFVGLGPCSKRPATAS